MTEYRWKQACMKLARELREAREGERRARREYANVRAELRATRSQNVELRRKLREHDADPVDVLAAPSPWVELPYYGTVS